MRKPIVIFISIIITAFISGISGCSDDHLQIPDAENYYCIENDCLPVDYRAFIDSADNSHFLRIELYGNKPFILGSILYINIYNSNLDSIPQSGVYNVITLDFNNQVHASNSAEMYLYALIQDQIQIAAWPVTDLPFIEPKVYLNITPIDSKSYKAKLHFKGFFKSDTWDNYKMINIVLNEFIILT
jgi:hypothetical protein